MLLSKKNQLLLGFGVDSGLHSDQEWGQFEWRQFNSDGKTMEHFRELISVCLAVYMVHYLWVYRVLSR